MVLTHSAVATLAVADIEIPPRRRELRSVDDLAESIATLGLLNPITVTPQDNGYRLVAGFHRIEACKSIGWETIPAIVRDLSEIDAELAEIDENLIRNELSTLERAEHLARRKQLYESKYPEARRGGNYGNQHTGGKQRLNDIVSFSQDTSSRTGQSERSIQRDVRIADHIPDDVRDALRQTPIADRKVDLLELAGMEPSEQREIVNRIVSGDAQTVKDAKNLAVHFSSSSPEWYTPQHIIECVVDALGAIDVDPCSNSKTDPNVPAKHHLTVEDDGLSQPWFGRVYMNPPYGSEIKHWVDKLATEFESGHTTEAIALVPARTDTAWFRRLPSEHICFVSGRLAFSGHDTSAPFPSAVLYLGNSPERFASVFRDVGLIYQRVNANESVS